VLGVEIFWLQGFMCGVFAVSGKLVCSSDEEVSSINLENFTPGMYVQRATGFEGQNYQAKFMVQ